MRSAWLPVVLLLTAACELPSSPGEQGFECDPTADAPCVEGLTCVATSREAPNDDGELVCEEGESFCSTPCTVDADCSSDQICVANCDDGDGGAAAGACFVGSSG